MISWTSLLLSFLIANASSTSNTGDSPLLKLHHVPMTRAGRIVWLLEELGLDYELNSLTFSRDSLKGPEHRERHPLGRIPVLEDGDITLYESGAIVDYVLERHRNGGLKPASDSPHFPAYLQWFHYCEGMVMPPINTIVVHTQILPEERRDAEVLRQAKKLVAGAIGPVNAELEGKDYLIGDFSGADIMLGHAMYMCNRLGLVGEELPHLQSYVARIASRPAFDKAIKTK